MLKVATIDKICYVCPNQGGRGESELRPLLAWMCFHTELGEAPFSLIFVPNTMGRSHIQVSNNSFHTPLIHGYSHLFPRSASVPSCREQAFDCNIEWLPLPCLQRKNVNGSHILNSNFFLQSFFTSPCLQTPLSCLRLPVDERRKWNCKFLWRRNLKTNHLLLAEHFVGWYILF